MPTKLKLKQKQAGKHDLLLAFSDKKQLKTLALLKGEAGKFIEGKLKKKQVNFSLTLGGVSYYFAHLKGGKTNDINEKNRRIAADTVEFLKQDKASEKIEILDFTSHKNEIASFLEGLLLANYRFDRHKTNKKNGYVITDIDIISNQLDKKDLLTIDTLVDAVFHARDFVNEPHSHQTAEKLAKDAKALGDSVGIKTEILNKSKIKSLKMGGVLAVNKGSVDEPRFIIMEYKPKGAKNKKPIVLVGKGIVYDTGGMSLKSTANSMDFMKADMGGAAAVIGGIYAIAKAKLPVHVVTLVPATDNRPGGNAYVPGDVITMHSGKTVEVLNTDAEGRLVLADALHYAKRYKPELVLDFATLTGAAAAAVGPHGVICMGTADKKEKEQLVRSGDEVCERLVEFPFWEDYDELIDSDIADIKNIGGNYGGAITAGKFLSHFVDYPWLHFDIAGSAFTHKKMHYIPKGGTGVGVRLLFQMIKNRIQ